MISLESLIDCEQQVIDAIASGDLRRLLGEVIEKTRADDADPELIALKKRLLNHSVKISHGSERKSKAPGWLS